MKRRSSIDAQGVFKGRSDKPVYSATAVSDEARRMFEFPKKIAFAWDSMRKQDKLTRLKKRIF